ncbi:MAG TPA: hypothetical protein VGY55_02625 [Pirellulales bacterium]|jgi:hypothetical protein|nr:hypothetical protein [Pirellulales bacterium]
MSTARAASTINVGSYLLLPNTPGQVIQIPVSGTDMAPGADLAVQVGDGGPQLSGTPGPTISNIGLTTGTIFAVPDASQSTPSGNKPQVWFTDVFLTSNNPSSVLANGVLANLTLDTTGFSNGSFALLLSNVATSIAPPNGYSTDLTSHVPNLTINNGSITIIPTAAYWQGNVDGNWSTNNSGVTNWKTDAAGATDTHATPGSPTDVFFTTTGGGSNVSTTLDADFSIKGLTFTSAATNAVSIGGSHTLSLGADGLTVQAGAAAPTISSAVTLRTNQTWTVNGANPLTVSGVTSLGGFTLTKTGTGTVRITGTPNLSAGSALAINSGALQFNVASGSATVSSGVTANVSGTGTLELAGSVSALGTTTVADRVNISNSSTAAAGLLVSGGNQQVGGIDGSGNVQVNAGARLTANHITAGALVIGGVAGSSASVIIDASDSSGQPLASGFALASSLSLSGPFAAGTPGSSSFLVSDSSPSGSLSEITLGGNSSAVPEPSTLVLAVCCLLAALGRCRRLGP